MGAGDFKCTDKEIKAALWKAKGMMTYAARLLKMSTTGLTRRVASSPKLSRILKEVNEANLDLSETKLMQLIGQGDFGAIRFHLERKGKDRGYAERKEVTGANGGAIAVDLPAITVNFTSMPDRPSGMS